MRPAWLPSLLAHVLACLLLLVSSCAPLAPVGAQPAIPWTRVSSPLFRTPDLSDAGKFFTFADVLSPPALQGTLAFAPAPMSGPLLQDEGGAPFVDLRVVLAHSGDSPRYGCGPLRSVNDEGESLVGAVVLVERQGPCNFAEKALAAGAAGARAVLYHGCPVTAPESCRDMLSIVLATAPMPVPMLYVGTQTGYALRNYLQARRERIWAEISANLTSDMTDESSNSSSSSSSSSTGAAEQFFSSSSSTGAAPTGCGKSEPEPIDTSQPLVLRFATSGALDPEERAALSALVNARGEEGIVQDLSKQDALSSLRPFTAASIDDPTLDPCLHRVVGLYCEHGRVVSINWNSLGMSGSLAHPAWGNLTQLRGFEAGTNALSGPVGEAWCRMLELRFFIANRNALTVLPECLTALPKLVSLSVNANSLRALPASLARLNVTLRVLSANYNMLGAGGVAQPALPANWTALRNLWHLDLSSNPMLGKSLPAPAALPYFPNATLLCNVLMSDTGLTGKLAPDAFDDASMLYVLDLSENFLNGTLPSLCRCASLSSILLNNNRFGWGIPPSWSTLQSVTTIKLQNNQLVSPVSALGSMMSVSTLWLSNNLLRLHGNSNTNANSDVGAYISSMATNALRELLLDNNRISGRWSAATLTPNSARVLSTLSLAFNDVQSLPSDMFGLPLTSLDLQHNNVSGELPVSVPLQQLQYLNLQRNPRLSVWPLPSWAVASHEMIAAADGSFSCPLLASALNPLMQFRVDASFTSYRGCACARGSFGLPPLCAPVPLTATVTPIAFRSAEVGANYELMLETRVGRGNYSNMDQAHALNVSDGTSEPSEVPFVPALTDAFYGQQRMTLGVSTSFEIDCSGVFLDTQNSSRVVHAYETPTKSTHGALLPSSQPSPSASSAVPSVLVPWSLVRSNPDRFVPVRVLTLVLHLNTRVFDELTDQLDVLEGGADLKGARLLSIDGLNTRSDEEWHKLESAAVSLNSSLASSAAYQTHYADALQALDAPPQTPVLEVRTLSSRATLHFTSRDAQDMHFFATYSYDFQCPPGFALPELAEGNISDAARRAQWGSRCVPIRPNYVLPWSLRIAVLVMGSLSVLCVLIVGGLLVRQWQSALLRAASRRFLLLMLLGLGSLGMGSLLYAAVPNPGSQFSRVVCEGRAWLTCLPLSIVIATLLAKTHRVVSIFQSDKLVVVSRHVSDARVLRWTLGVVALQVAAMLVFSLTPLSRAVRAPGAGLLADRMVQACSQESGFYAWLAVQLSFFGVLMLASVGLAYQTRALPSAYNEASHILSCVVLLLFAGVLIVPLVIFVQDTPQATLLLQGLGQAVLTLLLLGALFGPKLYYLYNLSSAEQKQLLVAPPSVLAASIAEGAIMPQGVQMVPGKKVQSISTLQSPRNFPTGGGLPQLGAPLAGGEFGIASPTLLQARQLASAGDMSKYPSPAEQRRILRNDMNRTAAAALQLLSTEHSAATVVPFTPPLQNLEPAHSTAANGGNSDSRFWKPHVFIAAAATLPISSAKATGFSSSVTPPRSDAIAPASSSSPPPVIPPLALGPLLAAQQQNVPFSPRAALGAPLPAFHLGIGADSARPELDADAVELPAMDDDDEDSERLMQERGNDANSPFSPRAYFAPPSATQPLGPQHPVATALPQPPLRRGSSIFRQATPPLHAPATPPVFHVKKLSGAGSSSGSNTARSDVMGDGISAPTVQGSTIRNGSSAGLPVSLSSNDDACVEADDVVSLPALPPLPVSALQASLSSSAALPPLAPLSPSVGALALSPAASKSWSQFPGPVAPLALARAPSFPLLQGSDSLAHHARDATVSLTAVLVDAEDARYGSPQPQLPVAQELTAAAAAVVRFHPGDEQ